MAGLHRDKRFLPSSQLIRYLALLFVLCLLLVLSLPPIAQAPDYHQFADQRHLFGFANGLNVWSNFPFLVAGLYGLFTVRKATEFRIHLSVFYAGVAFVCLGSAYYHLQPDNSSLVYDRLPMTIAFMALFSLIIGEKVTHAGQWLTLVVFVLCGFLSVAWWHFGEQQGQGDLRFYALVQFFPMLAIVGLLIFSAKARQQNHGWWLLLAAYLLAKLFEHFDQSVWHLSGFVSGHSLKHLSAAIGVALFAWYRQRASG